MKTILSILVVVALVGCTKLSTNTFRTEQAAVNLAYGAYVGYTNALPTLHLSVDQSNAVKQARLKFAATVSTLDALRVSYETNSALGPQLQAITATLADQSSNLVWVINFVKTK